MPLPQQDQAVHQLISSQPPTYLADKLRQMSCTILECAARVALPQDVQLPRHIPSPLLPSPTLPLLATGIPIGAASTVAIFSPSALAVAPQSDPHSSYFSRLQLLIILGYHLTLARFINRHPLGTPAPHLSFGEVRSRSISTPVFLPPSHHHYLEMSVPSSSTF